VNTFEGFDNDKIKLIPAISSSDLLGFGNLGLRAIEDMKAVIPPGFT
jgi:hypothetical protein